MIAFQRYQWKLEQLHYFICAKNINTVTSHCWRQQVDMLYMHIFTFSTMMFLPSCCQMIYVFLRALWILVGSFPLAIERLMFMFCIIHYKWSCSVSTQLLKKYPKCNPKEKESSILNVWEKHISLFIILHNYSIILMYHFHIIISINYSWV